MEAGRRIVPVQPAPEDEHPEIRLFPEASSSVGRSIVGAMVGHVREENRDRIVKRSFPVPGSGWMFFEASRFLQARTRAVAQLKSLRN